MKYQIHKGSKWYGAETVFEDIQFEIRNTEKIAIVGRNGCGKTTLLKIIADIESLDKGTIHKESQVTIGYLAQTTFTNEDSTVQNELEKAFDRIKEIEVELHKLSEEMCYDYSEAILKRYANLQQQFEEAGGYTYQSDLMTIFTKFGFEEADLHRTIGSFSGGQKTRLAFVKLLLSKPDILLLDEPTNHLDIDTIEWLENYVKRYSKAVVIVSHDRRFLDNVVDVVYEIEYSVMRRYTGNYTNYLKMKKSDVEQQKSAYIRQQKEIQRMEELIEKFRYKKSKASFAQSKIKYLERMEKIENPNVDDETFHAHFQVKVQGGKRVLETKALTVGYDANHPLCCIDMTLMQKEKVAIIGPNGQGKSTFVKTLMHLIPPLSGEYLLGHQIECGYFDQELAQFQSTHTVLEEVWNDYPHLDRTQIRTALGCFLFQGEDVFKTVDCLSGGEKVRLSLVKLMLQQPNFLIMDEPTNHLDLIGKEALEEALQTYDGSMLFVSHDRYFISKLATAILVIDKGTATYYPMTYDEFMEKQKVQKEELQTKPKIEKKQTGRNDNSRLIRKLEKKISEMEDVIEQLKQNRFDPSYYEDYRKMQELDNEIIQKEKELEHLMEEWELYLS